jgi:hypothetical protein
MYARCKPLRSRRWTTPSLLPIGTSHWLMEINVIYSLIANFGNNKKNPSISLHVVEHTLNRVSLYIVLPTILWAGIAQSVQRLATGWKVRGSNPRGEGGRDFPHPSRPALESTQPPIQWVPGLSGGNAAGA